MTAAALAAVSRLITDMDKSTYSRASNVTKEDKSIILEKQQSVSVCEWKSIELNLCMNVSDL